MPDPGPIDWFFLFTVALLLGFFAFVWWLVGVVIDRMDSTPVVVGKAGRPGEGSGRPAPPHDRDPDATVVLHLVPDPPVDPVQLARYRGRRRNRTLR